MGRSGALMAAVWLAKALEWAVGCSSWSGVSMDDKNLNRRDGAAVGRAVESWLHRQVGPAHDALKADPSRAISVDQVHARLAAAHAKAIASRM